MRRLLISAAVGFALLCYWPAARAQFAGTGARDDFRDTSILRPPAGSKVALIVFEDLGCPACAHAHPIEMDVVKQTHVTLLRYDFPIAAHIWTFEGAVCARYIQETYGAELAEEFRSAVFRSQSQISSKDDLHDFFANWLQKHGKKIPPVVDPTGKLVKEVAADRALGDRLNVGWTPTVVVVTKDNYQVVCGTADGPNDPEDILEVVKAAMAKAR